MANHSFLSPQGIVIADTQTTRDEVVAEYRAIFGEDLVTDPETPQGALITAEVIARDAMVRASAEVANQVNPGLAQGAFLDALMALMGSSRHPATRSTIAGVTLGGSPGTIVPEGSRATTAAGDIFRTVMLVTLDGTGAATVDMIADDYGPISCQPHQLTQVAESVLGWETVDNANAAVVGRLAESDARARNRRRSTLALSAISANEAIISRVSQIPGVHSMTYRENATGSTMTVDGVSIAARSIYACIQGGTDQDIARALKATKTVGAAYSGGQTITITDEYSGQAYTVQFDRPTPVDVYTKVTVRQGTTDAQAAVLAAMQRWLDGEIDGDPGPVVGRSISPFEVAAAINLTDPTVYVVSVELSATGAGGWSSAETAIAINQIAYMPVSYTQVVII